MIISTDTEFFDTVYLKTDPEQLPRLIVEVKIFPPAAILYALTVVNIVSWHYRQEFTKEKDEVKIITNG